ncbi:hypothetical protein F4813DRAFT_398857 [Daldinia decipiens]|uniref:uncharacterized protein n=1 Tax=Daldinia decipiens TaxID=326647 RepID=UPI0020C45A24|nr:uncharacterized protein F4813DRAFT_398857 [Daldinia decipiens]KAI1654733.1 hypothetical protein F4813DRAFT_398857 [Daldinia decipiens]
MVVVAVAGGTGGVGRAVLDAIAKSGRHRAIVLSRTVSSLQQNNVEVVVSALLLTDEVVAQSQINLIRAAAQSGTVTKFIPSEYYIDFHAPIPGSPPSPKFEIEAEAELSRHPQLTWTLIRLGIFLDHPTMPHNPKPTYVSPYWVFIDIDHEQCVFPGDGSQLLVLTHSTDLAAYIECLVGLPAEDWPRESLIASNKLQVRDLAPLAKKVTGRDFKVTYNPVEAIREGRITPLPSNQAVFDEPVKGEVFRQVEVKVMLSMLSHAHDLPGKNLAELFPEVQATHIEDFLRAGWALKQSAAT